MTLSRVKSQLNIEEDNIFDLLQQNKCETCNFVFKTEYDLNSHTRLNNHKSTANLSRNTRIFNYSLTSIKAKSNLLKSARSASFEIKYNQKSVKLLFSAGMYKLVVLPLLNAFEKMNKAHPIKGNGLSIHLVSILPGHDLGDIVVDFKVDLLVDNIKVTFHAYNTTQNVKVEGSGYLEFVEKFLKPLFVAKSNALEAEIEDVNNEIIDEFGQPNQKIATAGT